MMNCGSKAHIQYRFRKDLDPKRGYRGCATDYNGNVTFDNPIGLLGPRDLNSRVDRVGFGSLSCDMEKSNLHTGNDVRGVP